jgi:hypothetical protein
MNCHWVKDSSVPGGKYHLPGCMGSAVYGPRGCTCPVNRKRRDIDARVTELERRLEKLETTTVTPNKRWDR